MMKIYARIDNGIVVEIIPPMTWPDGREIQIEDRFTEGVVKSMVEISGVAPVPNVGWRYSDGVFAPPVVLSSASTKAAKLDAIKAERDRRKLGGFKVGALWFHSDVDSRIQHLGLKDKARDLIAAGGALTDNLTILGQPVRWKTMDGSFATVTAQLAFDIVAAAGDFDAQLFAVAETHRAAMEATADPAAYDFSAGWPETFGG